MLTAARTEMAVDYRRWVLESELRALIGRLQHVDMPASGQRGEKGTDCSKRGSGCSVRLENCGYCSFVPG